MVDVGAGLLRSPTPTGDIYLARYEQLEPAFARLLDL
jgi:hypothetical protein